MNDPLRPVKNVFFEIHYFDKKTNYKIHDVVICQIWHSQIV